ncbi:hypothetical protein Ancab_036219 [Ancistrocladus abbreviatus]
MMDISHLGVEWSGVEWVSRWRWCCEARERETNERGWKKRNKRQIIKFNRTAAKHIRNVVLHYISSHPHRFIHRPERLSVSHGRRNSNSLRNLGCADIARKLSRAIKLAPNAAIHAIGSRSVQKAREYAESNGYPPSTKIYGSYEEVLDDPDVDAVYIPLPTVLHLRYAVLAAEKKKHVLLEKPVAPNVAELDKILEACEANGVQFMDSTMWMHHPRTAKMKEFLSDPQRFGHLQIVSALQSNLIIVG